MTVDTLVLTVAAPDEQQQPRPGVAKNGGYMEREHVTEEKAMLDTLERMWAMPAYGEPDTVGDRFRDVIRRYADADGWCVLSMRKIAMAMQVDEMDAFDVAKRLERSGHLEVDRRRAPLSHRRRLLP